jgi:hypothetical protein
MSSAMIAPTAIQVSPMDLEGNVRIPFQSSVLASGIAPDDEGWVQISSMNASANGTLIWSSLFGIPVNGLTSETQLLTSSQPNGVKLYQLLYRKLAIT